MQQDALVDQGKLDDFGVPSFSHQSERYYNSSYSLFITACSLSYSYSGFSDKDDDPFDDW